jgi:hypothetical protein
MVAASTLKSKASERSAQKSSTKPQTFASGGGGGGGK